MFLGIANTHLNKFAHDRANFVNVNSFFSDKILILCHLTKEILIFLDIKNYPALKKAPIIIQQANYCAIALLDETNIKK